MPRRQPCFPPDQPDPACTELSGLPPHYQKRQYQPASPAGLRIKSSAPSVEGFPNFKRFVLAWSSSSGESGHGPLEYPRIPRPPQYFISFQRRHTMPGNKGTGLTRRDFAKLGAAAAAGFTILSSQSGRAETNSDTLKVGLLGCGNRGTGAAMEMLRGNPNMKLIAMADLFEDRLSASRNRVKNSKNEQTAKSYAVEDDHCFVGLDAYKKILATDIDILVEGTLPYSRPKHIMAAIQAGKHLFTEKPAAVDPVGIRQVIEAAKLAKEKNRTFGAGTQRRHQKEYVETIKKIHDGAIGDIVAMR
ncbi:MAG: gfo/Idh/MocA family oxidoreductase, partial [Candidatus Omnitrophica bacterium COP1]|nr:gfo/Idh/MocA family oxidoreductase [Candidatus Omnitrophica bacterium COP1]